MKLRYFVVLLLVLSSGQTMAVSPQSEISLGLGYRLDSLDWSISGVGNTAGSEPNILSELEWRDMDILELKGEMVGTNGQGVYFRGLANYGWAFDGENQDSDYSGDNRTLEFSRSINDVDGSQVLDLSAGLGFTFYANASEQLRIIPLLGYSYHRQKLRMLNGNQVLWDTANAIIYNPSLSSGPALGPFAGLDSSYSALWHGPWLGVDVVLDMRESGSAFVRMEAHKATYFAQANWNLRSDFAHPVSFEHSANATGVVLELGWHNQPSRHHWVWGVTASLQSWSTAAGTDRVYFSNGSAATAKLNEVNWVSKSLNISLSKSLDNY